MGVLELRELHAGLSARDCTEREAFVCEACMVMGERILSREVREAMGMEADACLAAGLASPMACAFRCRLFPNIVPNARSFGVMADEQRRRFADPDMLADATLPSPDPDDGAAAGARPRRAVASSASTARG